MVRVIPVKSSLPAAKAGVSPKELILAGPPERNGRGVETSCKYRFILSNDQPKVIKTLKLLAFNCEQFFLCIAESKSSPT